MIKTDSKPKDNRRPQKGNFFRDIIIHNFLIKIMALFIALLLYLYVGLGKRVEKVIRIPLSLEKEPKHLTISGTLPPKALSLTMVGTRGGITKVNFNEFYATINLEKAKQGRNTYYPVLVGDIPKGVKVETITPDRIILEFSRLHQKLITVEPAFVNQLKGGVIMSNHTIRPRRIWISGPKSILEDTVNLYTEPIDLVKVKGDTEFEVKISKNISPFIRINRDRNYRVMIFTGSKMIEKEIQSIIPVEVVNLASHLAVIGGSSLSVYNIIIKLPMPRLASFDPTQDISFYLNMAKIDSPGNYEMEVDYTVPDDFKVESYEPSTIAITVVTADDIQDNR